jgi:hypothetical protein
MAFGALLATVATANCVTSESDVVVAASVSEAAYARSPAPGVTACDTAAGRKLLVGPGQSYAKPSAAAAVAVNGDVVVISAGDYRGDVAVWRQDNLKLCGTGGRARLFADGANAAGKGIWVIQGKNVVVDSIEFHNATVPDKNGAGIRAEGNGLTIINSGFFDNENGILGPNSGNISITGSEFARNGFGDGYSHNLYVGSADRLTVSTSYFHQAKIGHNLKSRARETRIESSYFMDGPDGTASYQIDVPNGGVVHLLGNLIQKGPKADNSTVVSYGAEGLAAGVTHTLTMVHNTIVSTYAGGRFIYAHAGVGVVTLAANLFVGAKNTAKYNAELASKLVETHSIVWPWGTLIAADNLTHPNFWPTNAGLAEELVLRAVPDAGYLHDTPRPLVRRPIATSALRRVGALQSTP